VIELDVEQPQAVLGVLDELRPEWVFNLAAHGAYSWQTDDARMTRINVGSVESLLAASASVGVRRFVHAGSSSEYGYKDHAPDEEEPLGPSSRYGSTKAAGTELVRRAAARGFGTVALRLYSVYGPWEEPGRFIPALLAHARRGTLPPLVDRRTARDFVFVEDVVDALLKAARSSMSGVVYNVATGTQHTIGDVVAIATRIFDIRAPALWNTMAPRSWDAETWVGRPDRIRRDLGWEAATGLDEGLRRTADWLEATSSAAERYSRATAL
jgi:dolichol-phosphate mannosyltransferase